MSRLAGSRCPHAGRHGRLPHVVNGYPAVDIAVVEDVLKNHLEDLLAFVATIRRQS